jgi:hypothetical protein
VRELSCCTCTSALVTIAAAQDGKSINAKPGVFGNHEVFDRNVYLELVKYTIR